ncbi:MAG: radical SAM protein [Clostridia bacterium]|nr:radical SAM protein [Clostridia bacterium]
MKERHANISIFVPHIGCPGRCSFCDQTKIACVAKRPGKNDVDAAVAAALKSRNYRPENTEIAFFGGSFTAIDREYMLELLEAAAKYVENGTVAGVRASTRPDAIDEEILDLLKRYHVTALELGAQSMDDGVLLANRRGHSAECVERAACLIKKSGISLGLQMMTGLLGDTDDKAIATAEKIAVLKPDTVRIYPTIVLKGTQLHKEFESGDYAPQSLEAAVELSAKLLEIFEQNCIKVIRLGLHEIDAQSYVAGPWHPAFSELVQSARMLKKIEAKIFEKGNYIVHCAAEDLSKVIGQKKANVAALAAKGINIKVCPKDGLALNQIEITKETI